MVEDNVGVTPKNQVWFSVIVVWAILITVFSGALLFSGTKGSFEIVIINFVSWGMYVGIMGFSLFAVYYLMFKQKWSVYLGETKMGWMPFSDSSPIRSPVFQFLFGTTTFSLGTLIIGILKIYGMHIPLFQVIGFAQVGLAWEPVVTAETLLLCTLTLTLARRLIINLSGGQNFIFYSLMLGMVAPTMFVIGYLWHGVAYSTEAGKQLLTGGLFFTGAIFTILFGTILLFYILHSLLNISNTAKVVFATDFHLFIIGLIWFVSLIASISYGFIIWGLESDKSSSEGGG